MKMRIFAKRCLKEIVRDPLSGIFALLLPLFLLVLFQQFDIPAEAYRIENFTPGILVFGFAFVSMFTAVLVAKDRGSSLLVRLAVSPMSGAGYVGGYALSVLLLVLAQALLFFAAALLLGLPFSWRVVWTALAALPVSLLFIALGILIGSLVGEKAASGVSSIVVQLVAFTSGMYFDGDMVGQGFAFVCRLLPFAPAVTVLKSVLTGGEGVLVPALVLAAYTVGISLAAALVFVRRRKG